MASNQYSPTAEQPYQPTVAPEVVQPQASPMAPQNPAPTGNQAAGNISHVGAVAGIADNILRGFMQGRAQRDAKQAMTTKRNTDMMEASYNSAASQLLQMHRDGVDPNSDEYKKAKDAVDGSFAAKNAYYAQHVLGGDQKPKKAGKGGKQDQPQTIGEMVQSKDPAVQAQGWLLLQKKAGPPVYQQIAASSTPQAQQQRQTDATMSQAGGVHAQNTLTHEQAQQTYDKYAGKSEDELVKLPAAEQQGFANAKGVLFPPKQTGTTRQYKLKDGSLNWYRPGEEPEGATAVASGAAAKPVRAFIKKDGKITSALLDPATNKVIDGSENPDIQPPASMGGKMTTGFYHYVDSDGNVHQIAETHTTTPISAGGGKSDKPSAESTHGQSGASTSHASATGTPGDRVLGHKGTAPETAAKKDADNLDKTFRGAMERLKHPTSIGDQSLVFDWVRSQIAGAGRMTNTEIQQAYKAGSLETRAKNAVDRVMTGKVDPTFRRQLVDDIGISARASRAQANSYNKKAAPQGATSEVYAADGKTLIGHVVNGAYVALPAGK